MIRGMPNLFSRALIAISAVGLAVAQCRSRRGYEGGHSAAELIDHAILENSVNAAVGVHMLATMLTQPSNPAADLACGSLDPRPRRG